MRKKPPVSWNQRLKEEGLGVIGPLCLIGGVPVQQGGGGHFNGITTDAPTTVPLARPVFDNKEPDITFNGEELTERMADVCGRARKPVLTKAVLEDRLTALSDELEKRGHARLNPKHTGFRR